MKMVLIGIEINCIDCIRKITALIYKQNLTTNCNLYTQFKYLY